MSPRPAPRLVLASASPRRRQLLRVLGLPHVVRPAHIDEHRRRDEKVLDFVERMAREKAMAVVNSAGPLPVLGADTVVEIDGVLLGKPRDRDDAIRMLERLSGVAHQVHTAVAVVVRGRAESLVDSAEVWFRRLDPEITEWYVSGGEPMDKAGAYAVQGAGGLLVDRVVGSPHTVVGLPIHRLPELFAACGLSLWDMLRIDDPKP